MEVLVFLYHPQLPQWVGVDPISGVLLQGPPGCGKTKLAHAIANETTVPFYNIAAIELVSGVSGESEEKIRENFQKAYNTAPSIVFIDEIDAIAAKRETLQRETDRRIVTQLMKCMDANSNSFISNNGDNDRQGEGYVLVIGATNRPNAIDPALRRPGRFDYEIELGVPDENARLEILSVLTEAKGLKGCYVLPKIARSTPGFVGADLKALVNKAGCLAIERIFYERKSKLYRNLTDEEEQSKQWLIQTLMREEMEKISITMADFEKAIKMVQPSTTREGFAAIPNVKWKDVGGLDCLRKELDRHIIGRIKNPEKYERFGLNLEMGVLLYGPPGCGKTLIAKAVANEAGVNFIHVKGPELLNKYVGESESNVRILFSRARMCSPCIVFFDEYLKGNTLGRFGKLLYVPLPSPEERGLILKASTRNKPLDANVNLDAIGRMEACDNFCGADLKALVNEAAVIASDDSDDTIKTTHFEQAVTYISPSAKPEQRRYYQILSETFKAAA